MNVAWLTASLDYRPASFDAGAAFWAAVSGSTLSPARGEHAEFTTLLPPTGDPWLRVQRLQSAAPARVHLDLHAHEPAVLRGIADGLGAVVQHESGFASYTSPGGLPFCVVEAHEPHRGRAVPWGRHRSAVDQVCLDVPHGRWEQEAGFWSSLLGLTGRDAGAEFRRLDVPDAVPLRVLLQRRHDDEGPVRAHLDIATDDPAAEVERVRGLGAAYLHDGAEWTTLGDPTGLEFCVTDRRPTA